ncbi:FERM and PDZ domain-containing protein 1 [Spea bombifrons]|uniref:FERM and PDZ domain-containing protein 1 n=1 Tax=Spea bombifrons TaxID=233779 RepID=UPI0023497A7B|nr:FERM and PDZ domain-containing protein 1 [Spea bombifrons]
MEDPDSQLFQTRKGHRIEQMVVRWLRRSRDNASCVRISTGDTLSGEQNQIGCSLKLTVVIHKDLLLHNYGFDISRKPPLAIAAVTAGSPAEGKLLPGDQILRINNESIENIPAEQVADMVRESGDSVKLTVLRNSLSPKSSFLTAEKRARLRSNPVKVRFAEEVIVNGHTQGNSLLFMPNVLKVYLENGQTKAFKFEKKTTVKDIILTLKEKLSINVIEHFALALEEQYNISKLYLLHEDELIEQVVQRRESHDYRCLFRVCFVPKDPLDLLQEDPVAFEYLYLQSCSDVLQERFATEMKCSVALRLAALHIQERIHTCGQSQKISFKYIEKDWGIDNFLSPTLLRSMRGKDIKKAISFHIKRNQCILEPRQKKPVSAAQVRLHYLKLLGDLKTYGGKIFNATLMLQDRESYVTLLVGAKYGISQIINNKLNIMTTLAEFANITRIELCPESEKVSLVKVYLQDIKPLSLLLESNNAKDISCLISGYCKLFVDSGTSVFTWLGHNQVHRVSAEEGYESRVCSDSEESFEVDSPLKVSSDRHFMKYPNIKPLKEEEEEGNGEGDEEECVHEFKPKHVKKDSGVGEQESYDRGNNDTDSISEASDSVNTESQGYKISWSSDSIDALEEDDLETCSSSRPEFFQFYTHSLNNMTTEDQSVFNDNQELKEDRRLESDPLLCFLQPSSRTDTIMDSSEHIDTEGRYEEEPLRFSLESQFVESNIMEYYSLCTNVSPASSVDKNIPSSPENCVKIPATENKHLSAYNIVFNEGVEAPILDPPPGFGDTSSDEEFFDAAERFIPTLTSSGSKSMFSTDKTMFPYPENTYMGKKQKDLRRPTKLLRKRRSYLQTDYTSQVTFPLSPSSSSEAIDHVCCYEKESHMSVGSHSPTVSSLKDTKGEPALLETKPLFQHKPILKTKAPSPNIMEMEPDTMEIKSVTDTVTSSVSAIRFRSDSTAEETEQSSTCYQTSIHNQETSPASPNWMIAEFSGRASPSQISLQLDDQPDSSPTSFSCSDNNLVNTSKDRKILDDFETEMKTFEDTCKNRIHDETIDEHTGFNSNSDPLGMKSLYFTQPEEPISSMNCVGSPNSPGCKNNRNCVILVSNGENVPLGDEEEHMVRYTSASEIENAPDMTECCKVDTDVSATISQTALCTLELSHDEEAEDCARLVNSETQSGRQDLVDSSLERFRLNYSECSMENVSDMAHNSDLKKYNEARVTKPGNCSCQLSYASCFRGVDAETDDDMVAPEPLISSLPMTIPPVSENRLFVENNHIATNGISDGKDHHEVLNLLRARIEGTPSGYGKLQDSVLDLQKILEDYKNKGKVHPQDKCGIAFSEQKLSLSGVSRKMMSTSQKILRSDQSSEEMYRAAEETLFILIHTTEVCLQFSSCVRCIKRQQDVHVNLQDLICTYNQLVQAAKKTSETEGRDLHLKLLSRQCTALTAAVFCLTQHYRTLLSL